jgi:MFS family permease
MFQHYTARLGLRDRFEKREAHNLYLEIAAETGILGILALGAIGIAVLRAHSIARRRFLAAGSSDLASISTAFLLGLLGYLLAGMFLHEAWARSWWMLVAIVLALPAVARHVPLQNRRRLDTVRPAPPFVPAANPSASPERPQWTDRRPPVSA